MQGSRVPAVVIRTRVRDPSLGGENPYRWQDVTSDSLFAGRRVAVFSLPGAFTPVCSSQQAPQYERRYDEIRALAIDEVFCIAVNDAFVMHQWGRHLGLSKVKLIPDGSGHFTRRIGMLVNKDKLGFGWRSWRYAMVVRDKVIEKWFEEPGLNDDCADDDPYTVTSPQSLIESLRTVR